MPKRFRTTVQGLAGDQALSAVATVSTRRTVWQLLDEDDRVLAEVADDHVDASRSLRATSTGRRRSPGARSRSSSSRAAASCSTGSASGSRRPAPEKRLGRSKLAKVLGKQARGPEAPTRPKDSVRALVHHRMATLVTELRTRDPLVREELPEGVHLMRVEIRRLRSVLATARPFLDRAVTDPMRDELAWLADALGEVRDSEVRRARLDDSIDALVEERSEVDWEADRVRSDLWAPLVAEHDRALLALHEVVRASGTPACSTACGSWSPSRPGPTRRHTGFVAPTGGGRSASWTACTSCMEVALDPALTPDERAHALHEARRATKRARYAVEPLRAVYGEPAVTLTKRLKQLQSALGEHQDTVVTRDYLHDLVLRTQPALDPAAALTAGALIERESRAAEEYDARPRPPGGSSPRVPARLTPVAERGSPEPYALTWGFSSGRRGGRIGRGAWARDAPCSAPDEARHAAQSSTTHARVRLMPQLERLLALHPGVGPSQDDAGALDALVPLDMRVDRLGEGVHLAADEAGAAGAVDMCRAVDRDVIDGADLEPGDLEVAPVLVSPASLDIPSHASDCRSAAGAREARTRAAAISCPSTRTKSIQLPGVPHLGAYAYPPWQGGFGASLIEWRQPGFARCGGHFGVMERRRAVSARAKTGDHRSAGERGRKLPS